MFATSSQRTNYVTDWNDIQPRFGFAFQFAPKMVVRGGYGIYYGQSRSGVTGVVPYGGQGFNQYTNVISTYQNDGATPYLHLSNPYPERIESAGGQFPGLVERCGIWSERPAAHVDANLTPYEQSWSLGIERQLPGRRRAQCGIHRQERDAPSIQRRQPAKHVGAADRESFALTSMGCSPT